jgi:hypothetical protein
MSLIQKALSDFSGKQFFAKDKEQRCSPAIGH